MKKLLPLTLLAALPVFAQVKITQGQGRILIDIDGKPFTTFYVGTELMKPYLHPLRAASGTIVTRHFPMEKVAGETNDHPHHRGCFFGRDQVNGIDFWGPESSPKAKNRGRVVLTKPIEIHSDSLTAHFNWLDPEGAVMISEIRTLVFHSDPKLRIFDFDSTLTPAIKITFGDTKEGMFAIRVAETLKEDKSGKMVNAEGKETEANVWGKRSEWVDYSGVIDGEKLGIAILAHPANLRNPPRWHSRAYGLFAVNPIGEKEYTGNKDADGSLTVEAGEAIRLRYRVVIHPGDVRGVDLGAMYEEYGKAK